LNRGLDLRRVGYGYRDGQESLGPRRLELRQALQVPCRGDDPVSALEDAGDECSAIPPVAPVISQVRADVITDARRW
jgi:hypothetical protein